MIEVVRCDVVGLCGLVLPCDLFVSRDVAVSSGGWFVGLLGSLVGAFGLASFSCCFLCILIPR